MQHYHSMFSVEAIIVGVYYHRYMYSVCVCVLVGRTGVLVACYLVYSSRISPTEAIKITREKVVDHYPSLVRPGAIQMRGQLRIVHEFSCHFYSLLRLYHTAHSHASTTLGEYMERQREILHGRSYNSTTTPLR